MDQVASVFDKVKAFAKSTKDFVQDSVHRATNSKRRNPIEILKRLQRESFSDLMKLRERQDKVEKVLSFYKNGKWGPFQQSATHVRGEIDVIGALVLLNSIDGQTTNALREAGIRTGIHSKFIFETIVRQKDILVAELASNQNEEAALDDFRSSLSLSKLAYSANVNDRVSVVAVPMGARYEDIEMGSKPLQGGRLTQFSPYWPPLFDQIHDCGACLIMKGSQFNASLGGFLSWLRSQSNDVSRFVSMLGKVTYHPLEGTKLSVVGLHQMLATQSRQAWLGPFMAPLGSLKFPGNYIDNSASSVSLLLESEIDESSKINGWVEWQRTHPKHLQWSLSLSDTPEDEIGWGFRIGGMTGAEQNHCQMEAFLNCNMGNRFIFRPGFVYSMSNRGRVPAIMFRTSWSL